MSFDHFKAAIYHCPHRFHFCIHHFRNLLVIEFLDEMKINGFPLPVAQQTQEMGYALTQENSFFFIDKIIQNRNVDVKRNFICGNRHLSFPAFHDIVNPVFETSENIGFMVGYFAQMVSLKTYFVKQILYGFFANIFGKTKTGTKRKEPFYIVSIQLCKCTFISLINKFLPNTLH